MKYSDWGREVIEREIAALTLMKGRLSAPFDGAVKIIKECRGKVVVTGIGKSGHIGRKIAATMASLGAPAFFIHSSEALHGDAGMMDKKDIMIAISNSGGTAEVVAAASLARGLGLKIIAMTGKDGSPLAALADVVLDIGVPREADHIDLAPTSSSTVTLALGDALAVAVSRAKGFQAADFSVLHPGGALGRKSAGKKK